MICACETGLRGDDLCPVCNGTPDFDDHVHAPPAVTYTSVITSTPEAYTSGRETFPEPVTTTASGPVSEFEAPS